MVGCERYANFEFDFIAFGFSIRQGALPWQRIFVGFTHRTGPLNAGG